MADEIQLKVSADIKEVNSAITATKKFEKQITNTVKALNAGKITNKAYNQSLLEIKRGYQEYSTSSQKATADVRKMANAIKEAEDAAKQQELAKAAIKNTQELNRLKMGYDKVYAAEQKRLRLKKLLRAEVAAGNMTLRQAGTELLNYRNSLNQVNGALGNTRNRMNAGGMAMQQVGYQVGDFLVQAQSGTNLFVAFGQQATQLVGILPMVATQLGITMSAAIGLSAGLGIIIPLATAIGAAFMMSKSSADDLTTTLDELENAYSKINSINDTLEVQLVGTWAAASEGADSYLRKLREVTQESARAAGEDVLTRDAGILAQFKADLLGGDDTSGIVSQMDESIQDLLDKRQVLVDRVTDPLIGKKGRDRKFAELMPEAERLLEVANRYKDERQEFLNVFAKGTTTEESVIRILALREKYEKSGGDAMLKRIDGIITELKLEGEITAYRKKQADAQKKQIEAEIDLFNENLAYETRQEGLASKERSEGDLAILKRQAQAEIDLFNENMAYEKEQKRLDAAGDLAILNSKANAELELFQANAKYEAEQAALRLKEQRELNNEVEKLAERLAIPFQRALELIRQAKAEATVGLDAFGGPGSFKHGGIQTYTPESSKVGKGKEPTTMEGPIKALERQIELSKALFGLEGDERRRKEVFMQLEFQNRDLLKKYQEDPARLQAIADEVAAQEKLTKVYEEQRQAQEALADSIAGSMGDAFMSIVDGTMSVKDAFKSMARSIIKELYEVLVVQQLVGSAKAGSRSGIAGGIMDFFGNKNGNAMYGGNVIPFANGGVVGSPTTFPMSAGRTGLMGEAGPEAIMPLKRGKNGKLGVQAEGGSGDVVIHQNFNFQANGDDSVKKLIAQAAPQIAQMTKSSIISDRRRGGQMKATFG